MPGIRLKKDDNLTTPDANHITIGVKADGTFTMLDDGGTETPIQKKVLDEGDWQYQLQNGNTEQVAVGNRRWGIDDGQFKVQVCSSISPETWDTESSL